MPLVRRTKLKKVSTKQVPTRIFHFDNSSKPCQFPSRNKKQRSKPMGLDILEIVLNLEEVFGIEIKDKEAEQLRTTRDVIDYVCQKLNVSDTTEGPCLSARAFYRLRQ